MSQERKLFEGQTNLTIFVESGINLSDAESVEIKYIKPNGQKSYFPATIVNKNTGIVKYDQLVPTDLIPGTWKVWLKIIMKSGKISIGSTDTFRVYEEGSL